MHATFAPCMLQGGGASWYYSACLRVAQRLSCMRMHMRSPAQASWNSVKVLLLYLVRDMQCA